MEAEIVIRGYPSRMRFAEWQQANLLAEEQLPRLTEKQKERVRRLHISEKEYAVVLKAGELAQAHSLKEMEKVANCIRRVVREQDPESELTTLFWDFGGHKFEYIIQHSISPGRVKECPYAIPPELVDELVLGREGAEERLAQAVGNDLALMAG